MTQTYTSGQILTAAQVNAELAFPTGSIIPYAGSSAPATTLSGVSAWLLADGSAVSRTTYATLFALIGTTYGSGNGSTTFNVPDMRGRHPVGAGTGAGQGSSGTGAPSGTALTARSVGGWGGDERMQDHTHNTPGQRLSTLYTAGGSPLNGWNAPTVSGDPTGNPTNGGGSGGNMSPFIITNYIIKT